ncbi:MAG TPA: transposase [Cytophagales bacterium]|nr:transposase [Cytophagales bacterium]HAA22852.1 transposase [Cytophagales bacterium]HAP64425.1 transposase [Cytophagales bacterium]
MSKTYSALFHQAVFAVKYRKAQLEKPWRQELFQYMAGILSNHNHHPILINGVEDHVHLFYSPPVNMDSSKIMQLVKANSSKWINERGFTEAKFQWQTGFGVFSYIKSQVGRVRNYVANQETHHQKTTFQSEYRKMLFRFEVEFDERDLF